MNQCPSPCYIVDKIEYICEDTEATEEFVVMIMDIFLTVLMSEV